MKKDFKGKWLITEMELWDKDFIDLEEEGYFLIGNNDTGKFKFGAINGQIDYVLEKTGNEERLEFTWDGTDEMDHVGGRGWIVLKDKGIYGRIFFYLGDNSWFRAVKAR